MYIRYFLILSNCKPPSSLYRTILSRVLLYRLNEIPTVWFTKIPLHIPLPCLLVPVYSCFRHLIRLRMVYSISPYITNVNFKISSLQIQLNTLIHSKLHYNFTFVIPVHLEKSCLQMLRFTRSSHSPPISLASFHVSFPSCSAAFTCK